MPWEGPTQVMRAALEQAGADWRWRDGTHAFRVGPDLGEDNVFVVPVVPFGKERVRIEDVAVYYVGGEARPLVELLDRHVALHGTDVALVAAKSDLLVVEHEPRDLRCGHDWHCSEAEELWAIVMARHADAIDNVMDLSEEARWDDVTDARNRYADHVARCEKVGEA